MFIGQNLQSYHVLWRIPHHQCKKVPKCEKDEVVQNCIGIHYSAFHCLVKTSTSFAQDKVRMCFCRHMHFWHYTCIVHIVGIKIISFQFTIARIVEWNNFVFLELLFQKYCHNVLTDWNILNDSQWESLMFWCEDIPIVWTFCHLLNGEKFSLESEIISLPHKNFNV